MTTNQANIDIRKASERGTTDIGWLKSHHSFSFGQYHDPANMGYRSLRVINDDIVSPGRGFGTHPHREMEIMTWVLSGSLMHEDSTGSRGVIVPGELQAMSAGRGIRHSEMNPSKTDPVHLLQIWIEPDTARLDPGYQQRAFAKAGRANQWQVLASTDGRAESLVIHQSAVLSVTELEAGATIQCPSRSFPFGYLHIATGRVRFGNRDLEAGDALDIEGEGALHLQAIENAQILYFDLK